MRLGAQRLAPASVRPYPRRSSLTPLPAPLCCSRPITLESWSLTLCPAATDAAANSTAAAAEEEEVVVMMAGDADDELAALLGAGANATRSGNATAATIGRGSLLGAASQFLRGNATAGVRRASVADRPLRLRLASPLPPQAPRKRHHPVPRRRPAQPNVTASDGPDARIGSGALLADSLDRLAGLLQPLGFDPTYLQAVSAKLMGGVGACWELRSC